jgi:hypothetical protein
MGLDMRPLGKPKAGFEEKYNELFSKIQNYNSLKPSFFEKLLGKKIPTEKELIKEWQSLQEPSYETIKAPRVGRDEAANIWIKEQYLLSDKSISEEEFVKQYIGYYVIELAEELDGVPMYMAMHQDRNVFRGQFLTDCIDILGEPLVSEAWETKSAEEALDYGLRIEKAADKIASENNLACLKNQRVPPEVEETSLESKLHIAFSLAKWLIFYGKNGHGYEADY